MLDCKISSSIAWQDVSKYDLLYVLTLDNGKFFYFRDTGRYILNLMLKRKSKREILAECVSKYDVEEKELIESLEEFISDLVNGGILENE